MIFSRQKVVQNSLSPQLRDIWGFIKFRFLILATEDFIVFIDEALEVDWKSTSEWDASKAEHRSAFSEVISKATVIESRDWDHSDEQRTINLKRQIGEAIARALEGNFRTAGEMLDGAEEYRQSSLSALRRREAIKDQVKLKNSWRVCFRGWTVVHYAIGISAIVLSTLAAAKPMWLGDMPLSIVSWIVAACTGLLTFLTPDKKADKYIRAWSALNSEITRYNSNQTRTVEDVLDACHNGESIIHEIPLNEKRRGRERERKL
jgi:hypothetical protein